MEAREPENKTSAIDVTPLKLTPFSQRGAVSKVQEMVMAGPSLCLDVCGTWEPLLTIPAAEIPYIQHACAVPGLGPRLKKKLLDDSKRQEMEKLEACNPHRSAAVASVEVKRTMQLPKILSPIVSTATSYTTSSKLLSDANPKSLQHLKSGICNGQRSSSPRYDYSPLTAAVVLPSIAHKCQHKRKQNMGNYFTSQTPPSKTKKIVLQAQESKNKCQHERQQKMPHGIAVNPLFQNESPLPQLPSKHQNLTAPSTSLPHHTCTAASRGGTVESLSLAPICQKLVTQKSSDLNLQNDISETTATEPIRNTVRSKKGTRTKHLQQLSGGKTASSPSFSPQRACMNSNSNKQIAAPLGLVTRGRKLKPMLPASQCGNSGIIIAKNLSVWTPANSTSIEFESTGSCDSNPSSQNTIHVSVPRHLLESNIPQSPPPTPPAAVISESVMETAAALVVPVVNVSTLSKTCKLTIGNMNKTP